MSEQVIPEAAVEAAKALVDDAASISTIRAILEAAAPHMLARHEAALEAVAKALFDADAFGRQATHADIMAAMRAELTK